MSRYINIVIQCILMAVLMSNAYADSRFVGTHFSGSGKCIDCHNGLEDNDGREFSLEQDWSTSMMANAARDPYWKAKVAAELDRNPQLSDAINDKCSRCHAPMANETAKREGTKIEILGEGFLNPSNPLYDHAIDGVSCTLCHQIEDNGKMGTLEGISGKYAIGTYSNRNDRPSYGQYTDPRTGPMRDEVNFTAMHGAHTGTSKLCATCHDLKTPFVDSLGNLASSSPDTEFPEQMPFTEWSNSDYREGGPSETHCQGCHMPEMEGLVRMADSGIRRPGVSSHQMLGVNTQMMKIFDDNRQELNVTATEWNRKLQESRDFLKTAANIQVLSSSITNGELEVKLKVINNTGHKLPSGYPSRRAFIHFKVTNTNNQIVFESGKVNADGSVVGSAVDNNSQTFEPHYDVITQQDQVQFYEPIMGDTDGNVTHTLLRAATYLKDNRITPVGFDKLNVPYDVRVAGNAATDADFNLGSDVITYRIQVGNQSNLTVEAALNFQTLSYGHLQDLFKSDNLPEVAAFKTMFENTPLRYETIDSVSQIVN